MRLKSIKLAGFKSFVDPTTVHFPSNLCAVVGPNGCGKSNIIDAVRWVLGESSARHLRGEQMTDVIFNGSSARKPVGQASIELVFDNAEGKLGGEYARFSEIAIRRVVTRASQSTYFLNGTRCRRRDVVDIFLGTGLGPRSYAIIEQGTISRLIDAKPDELRVYIEEAAGISRYKERRRETENRIRHTRDNLERVADMREELERQVRHLERQARAAERYQQLKAEEGHLTGQLAALRWRDLRAESQTVEAGLTELELARERTLTERQAVETSLEQLRSDHTEAHDAHNQLQARYYSQGAEIARLEQALQHQREQSARVRSELDGAASRAAALEHQRAEAEGHVRAASTRLKQLTPELGELEASSSSTAAALDEAERAFQGWQDRWDRFSAAADGPARDAQTERARVQHLEQQLVRARKQLERLREEAQNLEITALEAEVAACAERVDRLAAVEREQAKALDALQARIAADRDQNSALLTQGQRARADLEALAGRIGALQTLQEAAYGRDRSNTQRLERQRVAGLDAVPRAGEGIAVEPGWEAAVEALLGSRMQAYCVDTDAAEAAVDGAFVGEPLCVMKAGAAPPGTAGPSLQLPMLADRIRAPYPVREWLAGVYCVDDPQAVWQWRSQLRTGESIVTTSGLWVGPHWLEHWSLEGEQSGAISRARELEALQVQYQSELSQVEALEAQQREVGARLQDLEEAHGRRRAEHMGVHREHADWLSQLGDRRARRDAVQRRQEDIRAELARLQNDVVSDEALLREARARLESAVNAMAENEAERARLQQERVTLREATQQARERDRAHRDRLHQHHLETRQVEMKLANAQTQVQRIDGEWAESQARIGAAQHELNGLVRPQAEMQAALQQALDERVVIESTVADARARVEGLTDRLRDVEQRRREIETELQARAAALEGGRLRLRELSVHIETLEAQMSKAGLNPGQAAEQLAPDTGAEKLEAALAQTAGQIQRLGAINLAAIDEQKVAAERKGYLDAQHADLNEALETLESAIRRIDRETRGRFRDTFEQVNSGLGALFPKVFGGGHAELVLTGDDLLDTGVSIMARPPGKRNSTIHLLSGGEKALTALALVFAIFELNPSPFCMLDEVDAPLDDANVGRYAQLISEMASRVQFVYITHNKISMEMAHQLMGVTMQEPGVSRLVAVDIDEAQVMAGN